MELATANDWVASDYMNDYTCGDICAHDNASSGLAVLPNFLRVRRALDLYADLQQLKSWRRLRLGLQDNERDEVVLTERMWSQFAPARRFSSFDAFTLTPGNTATYSHLSILSDFVLWLRGHECARLMGQFVRRHLGQVTDMRITRYHNGDFIRAHKDAEDGRILRCNLYIDPSWQPHHGGCLAFTNQRAALTIVEPRFNTLVLTPISYSSTHWVETVLTDAPRRYSFAFSFLPD